MPPCDLCAIYRTREGAEPVSAENIFPGTSRRRARLKSGAGHRVSSTLKHSPIGQAYGGQHVMSNGVDSDRRSQHYRRRPPAGIQGRVIVVSIHDDLGTLVAVGKRACTPYQGVVLLFLKTSDARIQSGVRAHTIRTLMVRTESLKESNVIAGTQSKNTSYGNGWCPSRPLK